MNNFMRRVNKEMNRNIHHTIFIKVHSYPVTTGLVTQVEVNDKGGWIIYGLDQFHLIDGINTSKDLSPDNIQHNCLLFMSYK